jgi:hypothetical protein
MAEMLKPLVGFQTVVSFLLDARASMEKIKARALREILEDE